MKDFIITEDHKLIVNEGVTKFDFDMEKLAEEAGMETVKKLKVIEMPSTLREFTVAPDQEGTYFLSLVDLSKCSELKVIPDNAFSLNMNARSWLSRAEVRLPKSVEVFGKRAFYGYYSPNFIHESDSLLVKEGCFEEASVDSMTLRANSSTIELEENALQSSFCRRVLLEAPKVTLGKGCFSDCDCLEEVVLNCDMEIIPEEAFAEDSQLTKVVLPRNLREIKSEAFKNCNNLREIEIPDSVESISIDAFSSSIGLSINEIKYAPKIKYLGRFWKKFTFGKLLADYFYQPTKTKTLKEFFLENLKNSEEIKEVYKIEGDSMIITEGVISFQEAITDEFREKVKSVKRLVLSKSLKILNTELKSFEQLEEVVIPENCKLEAIGENCFREVTGLREIELPASLETLGSSAFQNSCIEKVSIKTDSLTIKEKCFADCSNLRSVVIDGINDDSTIVFEAGCFKYCEALRELIIDCKVERIPRVFALNCKTLRDFKMPNSVITVGASAFGDCENLETIVLSENLKFIDGDAFEGCKALKVLDLPKSLRMMLSYHGMWDVSPNLVVNWLGFCFSVADFAAIVESYTRKLNSSCSTWVIERYRSAEELSQYYSETLQDHLRILYPEEFAVIEGYNDDNELEETSLF